MAATVYTVVIARQDANGAIPFYNASTEDYFYNNGNPSVWSASSIDVEDDQGHLVARFIAANVDPEAAVTVDDEKWTFTGLKPVDDSFDDTALPTLDPATCYQVTIQVGG